MPLMRSLGRSGLVTLAVFGASCSLVTARSEGRSGACPSGMAYVANDDGTVRSFCIDRWEASVVEVRGVEQVQHSPYEPVTNLKVRAVSRSGVVPQGYISKSE